MSLENKNETQTNTHQEKLPDAMQVVIVQNVPKTLGEKTVSWINEVGINWLVNSALSLFLTKMYSEKLAPSKPMQNFFNKWAEYSAGKPTSQNDANLHDHAIALFNKKRVNMDIFETAFMCIAGTVLMFPYKSLRDNTQKIAYKLDRKFEKWGWQKAGTAETKAKMRNESMDNPQETKVSWSDLLIARVTGIAVAIFSGVVLEKHATGSWFSKFHPEGADKGEQVIKWNANKTEVIDIEDVVYSRGQNFKNMSLRVGRTVNNYLKDTAFGKWTGITTSTDLHFAKPTTSEDFSRLIIKELTLTGILAAVMPTTLNAIDWLRGKKSTVSTKYAPPIVVSNAEQNTNNGVSTQPTAEEESSEKELVSNGKYASRTERKQITDITPRKEQPAEAMSMGVM